MYKYGGYIYNYDGTSIYDDPDEFQDDDLTDDYDEVEDDWDTFEPDEFFDKYVGGKNELSAISNRCSRMPQASS